MRLLLAFAVLAFVAPVWAQQKTPDPVHWTLTVEPAQAAPGGEFLGRLQATIDEGYHLYSLTTQGAQPTRITLPDGSPLGIIRIHQPAPERTMDTALGSETERYDKTATFLVTLKLPADAKGAVPVAVQVRYQACSDRVCLRPVRRTAETTVMAQVGVAAKLEIPAGYVEVKADAPAAPTASSAPAPAAPERAKLGAEGLLPFLLTSFGLGLAAIFTPCVFPMIPITMSTFLNQGSHTRSGALQQALTFCAGVIGFFTLLGFLVTQIAGPFGVQQMASSVWANAIIATVFFVFGLSLLGAFELTLPSGLLTRLNRASDRPGLAAPLIMGLTLALTSFACVGPFMGTLLAASVREGGSLPLFGMMLFAAGLSAPFFLLALFPSWLKSLPRSGGWMMRVKVVMGFLVLAFCLKYLSVVDAVLQTGFLTRERFLAVWFVLFALAGLYLLGFLRLEGINKDEHLGVGRLLTAVLLLAFAFSLLPGLFGGRLAGELEAQVPPPAEGTTLAGARGPAGPVWLKDDLAKAQELARRDNKRLLVVFTGYACTNCHWMKANMFTKPEIAAAADKLVLIELYSDGTDETSLRNQQLQDKLFQSTAIPLYAVMTPDLQVIASFEGLTRDTAQFRSFLEKQPAVQNAAL